MNSRLNLLSVAAGLVCLSTGAAWAQSDSLSMFGIYDGNFAHLTSSGTASIKKFGSDGNASSRIGFRGTENLGGGNSASFWLEGAYEAGNGVTGNSNTSNVSAGAVGGLFGRRATASLAGGWGELRFGRDYVPGFTNLSVFSPFGTNGVGTSGSLFYPAQSAARVTNVRASNSVGYFLPNLSGFNGQLMMAKGVKNSNGAALNDDGDVSGLRLGYANGPIDVAYATTKTKITALGDFTQTNFGGSYSFGAVKPMILWGENKVGATKTKTYLLGVLAPVGGNGQFKAAYTNVKTTGVANDASELAVGYVHSLSKRTALYGNYAKISNKNNGTNYNVGLAVTTPGGSSSGIELGMRHTF